MKRLLILLMIAVGMVGCGDSTGPETVDIEGIWNFSWVGLEGERNDGATQRCNLLDARFLISQSGSNFSGSQDSGAVLSCSFNGGTPFGAGVAGETLENGEIQGNTIEFAIGSLGGTNEGTVNGDFITGTSTWALDDVVLVGTFTATRQ